MKKKSKVLNALVLAGVLSGVCASALAAVPEKHDFGEHQDYTVSFDGKDFVNLRIWKQGVNILYPYLANPNGSSNYTASRSPLTMSDVQYVSQNSLVATELESITLGMEYIYGLIGVPKNGVPTLHLVLQKGEDNNASAKSHATPGNNGSDFGEYFYGTTPLKVSDGYAGCIDVHLPYHGKQFYFGYSVLLNNGLYQNHTAGVVHEFVHALDIGINKPDDTFESTKLDGIEYHCHILKGTTKYNLAMHDAFGSVIPQGGTKREKVISYNDFLQTTKVPADSDKYFYGVETHTKYSGTYIMPVKADGSVDTDSNIYQILQGAEIAWPDDCKLPAVKGIPLNGYEKEPKEKSIDEIITNLELEHVELQNCLMSHQLYRNWGVLMEAEIGILQDIGYSIDRGKFYGGSLYSSGVTKTALDKDFISPQKYAIGYHVYGSNNAVDFGASIQPTGSGAVGIRVDGVSNSVRVNREVNLTGSDATAVLFSYGKNHNLSVDAPVISSGTDSVGLRFDFGDNAMGNYVEYRGSYIHGGTELDTREQDGKIELSKTGWVDFDKLSALDGPLMSKVDINSFVSGTQHAIFISKNAYVRELNLNIGATIDGNITSEWNPTGVLYTAKELGYTAADAKDLTLNAKYAVDKTQLMTALNFNDSVAVVGNIKGTYSLDMNITKNKIVVVTGDVAVHALKSEGGTLKVGYQKNVDTGSYSEFTGNIIWEEGNVEGSWLKTFNQGSQTSYTERPNQANTALSQMNAAAIMGWRAQNNDMNKRMGELRMKNGEKGVWARMSRGENKEDATKRQFNLYQVGYDQEIGNKWILGGALSMTKGNANASSEVGYAKGEDKSGAFSLYASRLNDDGSFIDLVAKYGKTSYDVTSYMITGMGNYDYSTPSMSVSAEIGKRLKKGAYWMEPQAEFTFGMVKSASYTTSRGISAEQERFNSAVGRIGAVFGRDLPEGNIYVRASFLHDFAGNSDLNLIQNKISRSYTNDLGGSWWEFGIGTNLKTGKHSYIYADVEKTCGGKMQTPWRWNLGARWSF